MIEYICSIELNRGYFIAVLKPLNYIIGLKLKYFKDDRRSITTTTATIQDSYRHWS